MAIRDRDNRVRSQGTPFGFSFGNSSPGSSPPSRLQLEDLSGFILLETGGDRILMEQQ